MQEYATVYRFIEPINNGFVEVCGRARVEVSDEDIWLYSVEGSFAGGDKIDRNLGNRAEQAAYHQAVAQFRRSFITIVLDAVNEHASFSAIKNELKNWFSQINQPELSDWYRALGSDSPKFPDFVSLTTPTFDRHSVVPYIHVVQAPSIGVSFLP